MRATVIKRTHVNIENIARPSRVDLARRISALSQPRSVPVACLVQLSSWLGDMP